LKELENNELLSPPDLGATEYASARPHVLDLKPDVEPIRDNPNLDQPSRREFLAGAAGVGATLTVAPFLLESEAVAGAAITHAPVRELAPAVPPVNITLNINGKEQALAVEPRVTLLDVLRERLHLTGTKKGCDHGQCGACTVHVDGRRINSCLTLAIMHQGQKITTIEGLAEGETLHPMQSAFIAHDGFQCGYCTPGQIMSAVAVVQEGMAKSEADIREQMSGNICRCGAYPNIVAAIKSVMDDKNKQAATALPTGAQTAHNGVQEGKL
jgi:xanthine dehydrogenase YagT iron-sulfur-binding subunit